MHQVPESEKILLINELLKNPRYPIRPAAARYLTKAQKLDLFDKLVQAGAITSESFQKKDQSIRPDRKGIVAKEPDPAQLTKDHQEFAEIFVKSQNNDPMLRPNTLL